MFYPNEMLPEEQYRVCLRAEDPCCSQSCQDGTTNVAVHQHYFNTSLAQWPSVGCRPALDLYGLFQRPWWRPRRLYG